MNLGYKILIIEDDHNLATVLERHVLLWGYESENTYNGKDGYELIKTSGSHLIILDLSLPELNGIEILDRIRMQDIKVPVITITTHDPDISEMQSYNKGANLFHSKPINFALLKVQIKMLLDSHYNKLDLHIGPIDVSIKKRTISIAGENIRTSKKEFDLLYLLMSYPGQAFTRQEIINLLQMGNYDAEEGSVDTLVSRMRKKITIGEVDGEKIIETVYGYGYKLGTNYLE